MPPREFPPDDLTILGDEQLYVRIYPSQDGLAPHDELGVFRATSGTLRRSGDPLSVDLSSLCLAEETRDRDTTARFHVAAFTAQVARAAGCRVVRDPLPDNPAHALVIGDHAAGDGALSMRQAKAIARRSRVVILNG